MDNEQLPDAYREGYREGREAGRREGLLDAGQIARVFTTFIQDKGSNAEEEGIRVGHVLSALSLAEHLQPAAGGHRLHVYCPGCDAIDKFTEPRAAGKNSKEPASNKPPIRDFRTIMKEDPDQALAKEMALLTNDVYRRGRADAFYDAAMIAEDHDAHPTDDCPGSDGNPNCAIIIARRIRMAAPNTRHSGAGAAGDQGPAKKPADTGPAPDIAAARRTALAVAAADIRLLASEGWPHAKAVDVLEMAARRIESIARGENLCSICRRYHGKEITHACE